MREKNKIASYLRILVLCSVDTEDKDELREHQWHGKVHVNDVPVCTVHPDSKRVNLLSLSILITDPKWVKLISQHILTKNESNLYINTFSSKRVKLLLQYILIQKVLQLLTKKYKKYLNTSRSENCLIIISKYFDLKRVNKITPIHPDPKIVKVLNLIQRGPTEKVDLLSQYILLKNR